MDRYLAAAYPTAVCAADYLPEGSIVLVCEGSLRHGAREGLRL